MSQEKYDAIWVSHSSLSDFLKCPRAYFYKYIYRNPVSRRKITLMNPPLALGQAVHEVIEALADLPIKDRFKESLVTRLEKVWPKVAGKKGGFTSLKEEERYKTRAKEMLNRVSLHPGPLKNLAVRIKTNFMPNIWLSEKENLILAGRIDWLEYLPKSDSIHIIDFKTGKSTEVGESLQLPIYYLIATKCQNRPVEKVSYWYIDHSLTPIEQPLPNLKKTEAKILTEAKKIKLARQLNRFPCPQGSHCRHCLPLEKATRGLATFVGLNDFGQEVYILASQADEPENQTVIH